VRLGSALLLPLLFCVARLASAGDLADLDARDGFRDARFGASVDAFEDLILLSARGARGTTLYSRGSENLSFGGAQLDGVTYGFYAGRLYFVTLLTSGQQNGRAALAELEERFGRGKAAQGDSVEYTWRGQRVLMHYRQDAATGLGMVAFVGLAMDARVSAESRAQPPEAGSRTASGQAAGGPLPAAAAD